MKKGLFITFEGGEGVGKSTQIKLLHEYLSKNCNRDVIVTREPGGSAGAEEIRSLLLKGKTSKWDKLSELLLFMAARRDHLIHKIWPAMEQGSIVLCDRFVDSTIAYQCFGYGFDEKLYQQILSVYKMIAGDFEPDLTFILDLDVKTGLNRSRTRQGNDEQRFEDMDFIFHTNLRNGFLRLAQENTKRYAIINADNSVENIHQELIKILESRVLS